MLIGLLFSSLIIGAVFTFVKPRLDTLLTGVIPQAQTNRFVGLVVAGVLVLASLWISTQAMRVLGIKGR